MRKRFKIKNLIRNNRYAFLSRGEERNLLPNAVRLEISGGGWTSPLLHSWGSLKKYGARLMCASNEPTPTRISKFASSLRNSALPLGEGQTKSGEHSPLLYTGHSQKRNGHRHVMLNLFQHLATVELHGYSKRLPQRRNMGGHSPLLYIGHPRKSNRPFSTSSRNGKECVRRALLPCGISNENWCGMTT